MTWDEASSLSHSSLKDGRFQRNEKTCKTEVKNKLHKFANRANNVNIKGPMRLKQTDEQPWRPVPQVVKEAWSWEHSRRFSLVWPQRNSTAKLFAHVPGYLSGAKDNLQYFIASTLSESNGRAFSEFGNAIHTRYVFFSMYFAIGIGWTQKHRVLDCKHWTLNTLMKIVKPWVSSEVLEHWVF